MTRDLTRHSSNFSSANTFSMIIWIESLVNTKGFYFIKPIRASGIDGIDTVIGEISRRVGELFIISYNTIGI